MVISPLNDVIESTKRRMMDSEVNVADIYMFYLPLRHPLIDFSVNQCGELKQHRLGNIHLYVVLPFWSLKRQFYRTLPLHTIHTMIMIQILHTFLFDKLQT